MKWKGGATCAMVTGALTGQAADAIAGTLGVAKVAGSSPHFKNAVGALAEGNMAEVDRHIFNNDAGGVLGQNCFVEDLLKELDAKAVLQFSTAWKEIEYAARESAADYSRMKYIGDESPDAGEVVPR